MEVFTQIGIIVIIAIVVSGLMRLLKQPLIIGYIFTGIIVGPYFLDIVETTTTIETFSHFGVALLLFIVGLSLSPRIIKEVGKVSSITGVGQVLFTSLIGFLIAFFLGFTPLVSIYICIALAFSSTIIIMKLLSDKDHLDTLYGRIAIGFLIVQDLIAVILLMIISSLSTEAEISHLLLVTILKAIGLIAAFILIGIFILPRLTKLIAKSHEFLLLFSVGWCLAAASLFHILGFSMEIGALLAGITLSMSHFRHEINSKMRPLRDFFLVLFFILLGSQMSFENVSLYIVPIIVFSLFVLIGNPLIVMTLMGILGYTKRNSFLSGLAVAQISEFSLIIISLGTKVGHLSNEIQSFVTAIALITIAGSTYMIMYAEKIYPHISKYLKIFERSGQKVDQHNYHNTGNYDIILFGYNRLGFGFLDTFKKIKKKFLVVDHNPEVIINLAKEGMDGKYGDAGDIELLDEFNFAKTKMVISTIPDYDTNVLLITKIREVSKKTIIIVVSHQIDEATELYDLGASYVVMPHFLGGYHTSTLIEKYKFDVNKFLEQKVVHIEHLKKRKDIGHEHPIYHRHK